MTAMNVRFVAGFAPVVQDLDAVERRMAAAVVTRALQRVFAP